MNLKALAPRSLWGHQLCCKKRNDVSRNGPSEHFSPPQLLSGAHLINNDLKNLCRWQPTFIFLCLSVDGVVALADMCSATEAGDLYKSLIIFYYGTEWPDCHPSHVSKCTHRALSSRWSHAEMVLCPSDMCFLILWCQDTHMTWNGTHAWERRPRGVGCVYKERTISDQM